MANSKCDKAIEKNTADITAHRQLPALSVRKLTWMKKFFSISLRDSVQDSELWTVPAVRFPVLQLLQVW